MSVTGFQPVSSESWQTSMYGEVLTTGFRLFDCFGNCDEETVVVEVMEPHGMCMTEWYPRVIGCYPMNPATIH